MINGIKPVGRSLRWGMVGGGGSSQIGYIHRSAALRDGSFTLLAGAFDIDAERGREFGQQLGVDVGRCYPDYEKKRRGKTALKRFLSPRRITPTTPFVARRLRPDCMWSAKNRSVLPAKRPMRWWP